MQQIRPASSMRHPVSCLYLLVLAALVLAASISPSAASATARTTEIPRLEVKSYKEDFGVSTQVAERNLETQQRGAGIVEQLEGTLGEDYAGVWFDNETGEFVVPTVTSHAAVAKVLKGAKLEGHFRTIPAKYSWGELEATRERLDDSLKGLVGHDLVQTALDPRTDSVVIREAGGTDQAERAKIHRLGTAEGGAVEIREAAVPRFRIAELSCDKYEVTCSKPLRGGVAIGHKSFIGQLNTECTAGFKAIGNTAGNRFVLTAGHCGQPATEWASANPNEGNKVQPIGWAEGTDFPGGDWEKIKANGSFWDTASWPTMVVAWDKGEAEQEHAIEYESSSYIGEWVCHSGLSTGTTCGSVVWTDLTAENEWGQTVEHVTYAEGSSLCAAHGDSGGPVYAGNVALGLVSGGAEEGPECGPGAFLTYVEITEVTDHLGVTVGTRVGTLPIAVGLQDGIEMTQPHQAIAHGMVDPNGITTNYHVDFGTTAGYGQSSSLYGAGSGWYPTPASATLNNLKGSTTYHYRFVAQNSAGTSYDEDEIFTTPSWPPIVSTSAASGVIHQEATLNGSVNPQGEATSYHFEYGPTTSYGTKVPIPDGSAGSGESAVAVSQKLTGLEDGTYHYRIVASNGEGTSYGTDQTFLIDNRPLIKGVAASNVKSGSATLGGEIEPQNFASTYHFEYVRDSEFKADGFSYAKKLPVPDASAGTGFEYHAVSQETGLALEPETLYHYRLVATNVKGMRIGEEKTFKTQAVPLVKDLSWGKEGSGHGEFDEVTGLAVDSSGNVLVGDSGLTDRVQKFGPSGEYLSEFGKHGSGDGEFIGVAGLALTPGGEIWAADRFNSRLEKFSSSGQFLTKFGTEGSGNNEFDHPAGIAIDPANGNIWVADRQNGRIQEFNSAHEYLRTIKGGSNNGPALIGPVGVALDKSGDVWVADYEGGRVTGYTPSGTFIAQLGSQGNGAGQLNEPCGVIVSPTGAIYVTDTPNGTVEARMQAFSTSGEYLGLVASGLGQNLFSFGLVLSGHSVYVGETATGVNRVSKFHIPQAKATSAAAQSVKAKRATLAGTVEPNGSATSYRFEYGTTKAYGTNAPTPDKALGSETSAQEVQLPATGLTPHTVYHYRLVAFNAGGASYGEDKTFETTSISAPVATTEAASAIKPSSATLNASVNPNEADTHYWFEYGKTTSYGKNIPVSAEDVGEGYEAVKVSQTPALEPNTTYHFRVRANNQTGTTSGEDRTFTTPRALSAPTYASSFGSSGIGNGQFSMPEGDAVDSSGNVWVVDAGNNRVQKFNSKGEFLCKVGSKGSGNGQFSGPHGIAADSAGNVWVVDAGNNRLQKIGSSCEYLSQFGGKGSGNGQLSSPYGAAVDPSGNIWVTDKGNSRIEKFNSKGEFIAACGSGGGEPGQFEEPQAIAADADGNVWVSDESQEMQEFNSKCEFAHGFYSAEAGAPEGLGPHAMAIDPSGNIWVTGVLGYRVNGLFPEGEYVTRFGESGSGAGKIGNALGLAAASDGTLWVVDRPNNRVEKWIPTPYPVETGRTTQVKRTEATLKGSVNPEGVATDYQFEYGITTSLGSVTPATPKSVGSGSSPVAVTQALSGLKAGTTYYYHLVATSAKGTTYGEMRHFKTLPGAGAGAVMHIGGKTFSELGISEAGFELNGAFKVELSASGNTLTFNCSESGSGTLVAGGVKSESVSLSCTLAGFPTCEVAPISFKVDGSFHPEGSILFKLVSEGEGCMFEYPLSNASGSFEYGSEGKEMNVNSRATAKFGAWQVTLTGNSKWSLTGTNSGKTLAFF